MTGVRGGARGAVGMVVLLLMLAATLVTSAVSRPAEAADTPTVEVVVRSVTPSVLRPESVLKLGVDIVNNTPRDLDVVTVQMRVGVDGMTARTELSDDGAGTREVTEEGATVRVPGVRAGQHESRELTVPVEELGLDDTKAGVYAFNIDALHSGSRVATARLLMPWIPEDAPEVAKSRIGVLWPLIDQPRRDGTTLGNEGQTPVFLNEGLTPELADGGRLDALVDIGATVPQVTWVVDPDLLDTAAEMGGGYRVAPPQSPDAEAAEAKADAEAEAAETNDSEKSDTETANAAPRTEEDTEPGTGGPAAAAWLEQLRRAAAGETVVALPYADTDLAAVAHAAGPLKTDLTAELAKATALGRTTVQRVLPNQPVRSDVAWPVAGAVDNPVLDTAKGNGASLIVAAGSSLQPRNPNLTYTSSTRLQLTDTTSALVTDPRIDALLAGAANSPNRRLEIQQALIAELFTIAMEQPQLQRSLLVALPRTADAGLAQAVAGALNVASGADGWSEMVSVDALGQTAAGEDRTMKVYPQELRRTEPSERYLKSIPQLQASVEVFAGILSRPERITDPYDPAVLRTLSAAWRGAAGDLPGDADAYRLDVTRSLRVLQQLVRIAPKTSVTLSGETGQVPITVINGLQQAITIKLGVESRQPNRLTLTAEEVRTIPGGHTSAIPIDAKSAANGKVLVDVGILTPLDDRPFGPTQTFVVNTTSIDGITLGIIGVIAGLLALFSLRAYLRRRRTAAAGEDGSGEDSETGGDDAPGPFGNGSGTHGGSEGGTRRQGSRDRPEDHHAPA